MNPRRPNAGFTFVEVLVAMMIFVMAIVTFVSVVQGSAFATKEAREISIATWLLQNTMTELETKLETEGFDKGCEKKMEKRFAPPFERFSWVSTCAEIEFNLSETAAKMMAATEESQEDTKEDQIQKIILQTAGSYMTKSIRELHAEVHWTEGTNKRKIDATTHVARFDQAVSFPGMAATGSTGSAQ